VAVFTHSEPISAGAVEPSTVIIRCAYLVTVVFSCFTFIHIVATVKVLAEGKAMPTGAEVAVWTPVSDVHAVVVTPGQPLSTFIQIYDTRGVVETDEVHDADNSPVLVGIYGVLVTTEEDARVSNCQVDSITTRVV
jgi:hypothetical protein